MRWVVENAKIESGDNVICQTQLLSIDDARGATYQKPPKVVKTTAKRCGQFRTVDSEMSRCEQHLQKGNVFPRI